MIKELAKVANKLDSLGLTKEADLLDSLIRKEATKIMDAEPWLQGFVDYLENVQGFTFDGDIIIMDDGESFPTPMTIEEAVDILSNLGLTEEEMFHILLPINKSAMHLGEGYLTCDECGTRFSEFKAGSKTSRGHHVCPQCSGDVSPEEVEKRRSGAFESFRSRRSRD